MNQSALIISDFSPILAFGDKVIDIQPVDFKDLYWENIKNKQGHNFYTQSSDPEAFFRELTREIVYVKAAGGIVKNGFEEYLFIKRLGKWDLPKGKLETGENMKTTAIREVEEECGIRVSRLGRKIQSTYHCYTLLNEIYLKKTNWYAMEVDGRPDLKPQVEEDITSARWLKRSQLGTVKSNTYPLIKDLIDDYGL